MILSSAMKISLTKFPIKGNRVPLANHDGSNWCIKTDGPSDDTKIEGGYVVLCADGSVFRRTIDEDGNIVHEIKLRDPLR